MPPFYVSLSPVAYSSFRPSKMKKSYEISLPKYAKLLLYLHFSSTQNCYTKSAHSKLFYYVTFYSYVIHIHTASSAQMA